jgi:hypothetical protein
VIRRTPFPPRDEDLHPRSVSPREPRGSACPRTVPNAGADAVFEATHAAVNPTAPSSRSTSPDRRTTWTLVGPASPLPCTHQRARATWAASGDQVRALADS